MSPIKFESRVYRSEKQARRFYNELLQWDRGVHPDFRKLPKLNHLSKYERWIVSWSIVYPEKRKVRRHRKRGVMYPYAVILLTLFAMAFFWVVWYMVVSGVRGAVMTGMEPLEQNSTTPIFTLADTFVINIFTFFLMLMVIGLFLWVIMYSQHKGQEVQYF